MKLRARQVIDITFTENLSKQKITAKFLPSENSYCERMDGV